MANTEEQLDSELLQVAGQSGPGAAANKSGGLSDISEDDISDVNDDGRFVGCAPCLGDGLKGYKCILVVQEYHDGQ